MGGAGPFLASFTRTYIAALYDGESPPTPMRPPQVDARSQRPVPETPEYVECRNDVAANKEVDITSCRSLGWAWLQRELESDPQSDAGLGPEACETLSLRSLSSRLSLPLSEREQREVKLQVRSTRYAVCSAGALAHPPAPLDR